MTMPFTQLDKIRQLKASGTINITQSAKKLRIARNTLKRHIRLLDQPAVTPSCLDPFRETLTSLMTGQPNKTVKEWWLHYRASEPQGYCYSHFACRFAQHRSSIRKSTHFLKSEEDMMILQQWRRSSDRRKWEKAVILLETAAGKSIKGIAEKIERTLEKVREWLKAYREQGLAAFEKVPRRVKPAVTDHIRLKKDNLIRLIHEAPQLHGFNRTSWRLKDLSIAYGKTYGHPLSMATISAYLKTEGYVFRKARKVLTSPDPEFREKLAHIQDILRHLGPKEKFFSVDEYGPFSVKIKGGKSYTKQGKTKTYPQHQPSKGCLICTAALELSTNQVTHFYSLKKNTEEMIKLIDLLRIKYRHDNKLYFSWDAAVWHASKKLKEHLEIINDEHFRAEHHTPFIELAPLPSSAQFLNVIESVFSGLARSVIHHSDYPNVGYCKAAIDRYFAERNSYFKQHPKRAGKKIWGLERTVAEFRDDHNCKDPAWR